MDKYACGGLCALVLALNITPAISGDYRISPFPSDQRYPDYVYFFPDFDISWPNGIVYWKYNPANQPSNFTTDQVVKILKVSQAKWEQVCGIRFEYQGTTTLGAERDQVNVVKWETIGGTTMGVTRGYTNSSRDAFVDTDVKFDPSKIQTPAYLEAIATHEFGHALGLNHSETQNSIMFANPYHSAGYQMILRTDDANGCRSLYGSTSLFREAMPVNTYYDRLFNFAEDYASSHLSPRQQGGTQFDSSYNAVYRAYGNSSSYLAVYQGSVFYNGPASNNQWADQGSVEYWMPYASNAGYY